MLLKIDKNVFSNKFFYFYCFLIIHASGNRFFSQNKVIIDSIFLCISFVVYLIYKNNNFEINKNDLIFFIYAAVFFSLSMLFGNNESLTSYVHFLVSLLSAYFFAKTLSIIKFSEIYVKILTVLALSSLLFWIIGLVYPQFFNVFKSLQSFTYYYDSNRVYVNVLFLYTYISPFAYGTANAWSYTRNNGIFWEPGAYQFFLMLAIILLNEYCKEIPEKIKFKVNILLFFTLLTTQSTTGFIIFLILLFVYRRKILSKKIKRLTFYIGILLFVVVGVIIFKYVPITEFLVITYTKIFSSGYYTDSTGSNVFSRIGLEALIKAFSSIKNVLFGTGVNSAQELDLAFPNTYVYLCVSIGIPYAIMFMGKYYSKFRVYFKKPLLVFLCLVISFSSEQWIFHIVPLSLMFFEEPN